MMIVHRIYDGGEISLLEGGLYQDVNITIAEYDLGPGDAENMLNLFLIETGIQGADSNANGQSTDHQRRHKIGVRCTQTDDIFLLQAQDTL